MAASLYSNFVPIRRSGTYVTETPNPTMAHSSLAVGSLLAGDSALVFLAFTETATTTFNISAIRFIWIVFTMKRSWRIISD